MDASHNLGKTVNPLFVDELANDLRYRIGSPAIDRGTSLNAPNIDHDGVARPQSVDHDIGVFEKKL